MTKFLNIAEGQNVKSIRKCKGMSWHKVTSFIVNILETFLIQKVIVYHNTLNKFINMNIHCIETFAFNEKATKLCF